MNWTGGRLQRHSKANKNEVLQRQKQHFARVRYLLQSRKSSAAPLESRWTSRSMWEPDVSMVNLDNTYKSPTDDKNLRQMKLEHYGNTAPLAHRLAAMSKRSTSSAAQLEATQQSPAIIQSRNGGSRLKSSRMPQMTEPDKRASRADLALEQSRKRLLEQSDWVGLNLARPFKIAFASHRDREQLGKRRRIHKEKRRAHIRGAPSFSNALAPLVEDCNDDEQFYMRGALQPIEDDISVRIGREVLPSQAIVDTDSCRTDSDHTDVQSDVMLFEDDTAISHIENDGNILGMQHAHVKSECHQRKPTTLMEITDGELGTRSSANFPRYGSESKDWQNGDDLDPGQEIQCQSNDDVDSSDEPNAPDFDENPLCQRSPSPKGGYGPSLGVNHVDEEAFEAEANSPIQSPIRLDTQQPHGTHADTRSSQDDFKWVLGRHQHIAESTIASNTERTLEEGGRESKPRESGILDLSCVMQPEPGHEAGDKGQTDRPRNVMSRKEQREQSLAISTMTQCHDGKTEPESDPNTVWKRFIFDDSSSSMNTEPMINLVQEAARTKPTSSLFVWNSSASAGRTQPSSIVGNPLRVYFGAKSGRMRRRAAHRDLNISDNIPAASDAMLMFREPPEPLVWNAADTRSDHAIASRPWVVAASMINNVSMPSTKMDSTDRLESGSGPREQESPAPTTFNVQLASNAKHLSSTYAGRKDSRPAPVKSTRPAQLHDADRDSSHVATVHSSPVHAKTARARPGPKRIGAAGDAGRGKHIDKATKRNASSLSSSSSIYDFPYSDSVDDNGLVK